MTRYSEENWKRFQKSGVESEDIKAMKMEKVEDAFEYTEEDFSNLVEQLSKGIKEGRWTTILGDDVSGRLPALVIGKIITRYNRENKINLPKRIFFAGGSIDYDDVPTEDLPTPEQSKKERQEREHKLEAYIREQSKKQSGRILFVTEHLVGGRTLRRIAKALHKENVKFDVASLWSTEQSMAYESMLKHNDPDIFDQTQFFIGKENASASDCFGSEVSGLLYNLGVPLNEATGLKKDGTEPVVKLNKEADRDIIKLARQKVNEFSDKLYLENFRN